MHDDTLLVTAGRDPERHSRRGQSAGLPRLDDPLSRRRDASRRRAQLRGVYYGRGGTPTTFALEDAVAALDGAPAR